MTPTSTMTWSEATARRMARHQAWNEASLVGAVMQATPTLTVGTVTAGAHA
jgi:hypothetical protein